MRTVMQLVVSNVFMTFAFSILSVFSVTFLGEKLRWNYLAGSACMILAVVFVFREW